MIHAHSTAALRTITTDVRRQTRVAQIADALRVLGAATDRQVAAFLGKSDPNYVRPRITENIGDLFEEAGTTFDSETRCRVRLVRLRKKQRELWT